MNFDEIANENLPKPLIQIEQTNNTKAYLPFLDGIRGYAAFLVLTSHCLWASGFTPQILKSGVVAVDIFMIMSGFLMTYHYRLKEQFNSWNCSKTWCQFYISRFLRIAPLYYLLLIPTYTFYSFFKSCVQTFQNTFPPPWPTSSVHDPTVQSGDIMNVLSHITFTFGLFPQYAASSVVLPDWSIGLEMQFYALFPFIMLIFRKFSYFWVSIFLCATNYFANQLFSVYITSEPGILGLFPQPSFLPLKISLFSVGILLAESIYHYRFKSFLISSHLLIIALLVSNYGQSVYIFYASCLISFLLFYEKAPDPLKIKQPIQILQWCLSNQLSTFMAQTSYSVYLLHMFFLIPIAATLANVGWYVLSPGILRFSILFLFVAPPTYFVSSLLYKYVEKPSLMFGKILIYRIWFKDEAATRGN